MASPGLRPGRRCPGNQGLRLPAPAQASHRDSASSGGRPLSATAPAPIRFSCAPTSGGRRHAARAGPRQGTRPVQG